MRVQNSSSGGIGCGCRTTNGLNNKTIEDSNREFVYLLPSETLHSRYSAEQGDTFVHWK